MYKVVYRYTGAASLPKTLDSVKELVQCYNYCGNLCSAAAKHLEMLMLQ